MSRSGLIAAAIGLPLVVSGCLGYRVAGQGSISSVVPAGTQSIGIPPFRNETDQPEIDSRVTEALVDEFVRRGKLQTKPTAADADVYLEGVITGYRQAPVSLNERGRADRLEVTITARVRLLQQRPEERVLWSQNYFVYREQYDVPETPLAGFEREIVAVEEVARGFARSVITSMLEGF
jgi:hypothetical protein